MSEETTGLAMNRRSFVKGGAALLASTTLFGFAGCAPQGEGGSAAGGAIFVPGTYTASAMGKNGYMHIECELNEEGITSMKVTDHIETPHIADAALERIPEQVVEYQTLDVDSISGATVTCMAMLAAAADCVSQAGKASNLENKEIERSAEVIDVEADIVVIGAGASGCAAAVAGGQEGQNVILLEQSSNIGGNCLVSGGYLEYFEAPDELKMDMNEGYAAAAEGYLEPPADSPRDQEILEEARKDWEEYKASGDTKVFDSLAFYAVHNQRFRGGTMEEFYVAGKVELEAMDWLVSLGLQPIPLVPIVGSLWPRWTRPSTGFGGEGYIQLFADVIDSGKYPIDLMTETGAKEFITDSNGAVTGVVAESTEDGTTYNITAKKGVIIASGGYSGNPDMIKKYDEFWHFKDDVVIYNTNAANHIGSGITMAEAVGAQINGEKKPMMFPFADYSNHSPLTCVGATGNCLMVNQEGNRFVNETLDRWTLSGAIMEQADQMGIMISDANNSGIVDGYSPGTLPVEALIENGQLYRADTIEELAEAAGIDKANLVKSVELYNEYSKTYDDPDFGRTAFMDDSIIETPPFYASPRTWAAHLTTGGIAIADHMKDWSVVDAAGKPIEGLYAVGEVREFAAGIGTFGDGMACAHLVASK